MRGLAVALCALALSTTALGINILVYDNNPQNHYGIQGAQAVPGAVVTKAVLADFDAKLAMGGWDVVGVDCPSSIPAAGWGALVSYVNGGGRVVMSYWDWDVQPALTAAFGGTVVTSISSVGQVLEDMGTSPIFAGVAMPHSAWSNFWGDDGDTFKGGTGLAKFTAYPDPVMIRANGGKTIASFVIDEWIGADAITLWKNMYVYTIPEPTSLALLGLAVLALRRR